MKYSSRRGFRDRVLDLLNAVRRLLPKPKESGDATTPVTESSELVATVPGRVVFAAGERTVIEVTCPYCESAHRHLMSDSLGTVPGRKKARSPERAIVFDAPCGWGKYRVEQETDAVGLAGQ